MKRKLISFDTFKKIEENSLTNAQDELIGAEDVLAKTLGTDDLRLSTFGESDVTYEAPDGTYIHATYTLNKDQLVLENIEQLVIEEESEKKNARQLLNNMVESLLDNNDAKASHQFEAYLSMPSVRRGLIVNESAKNEDDKDVPFFMKKKGKNKKPMTAKQRKFFAMIAAKKGKKHKSNPFAKKIKPATMKEWAVMCENVIDFIDYKQFGPLLGESQVQTDAKGNITAVAIPTLQKRNEAKILNFNWKTLDHDLKIVRGNAKKTISEDQNFVRAMSDLKRHNNISDNHALEETLEAIVSRWPDVIYVTESELANQIAVALESANITNFDDNTCQFMAEAILRTAHNAYTDRVRKIGQLAGAETDITAECKTCEDSYQEFRNVSTEFFTKLDESEETELRVFSDLIKALNEVRRAALELGDQATQDTVEGYMYECQAILNRQNAVDLNLAESIASFLHDIVESNVMGSSDKWDVTNTTHISVNGEHPRTLMNAKVTDAVPSKYNGDWNDPAPVSDGKSYHNNLADEMRNNAWMSMGGDQVWPAVSNPYIPKAGDFKMKEPSAANSGESDLSRFQSNDTWPNLQNPYAPKADFPKAKSDDLVVDM